MRKQMLNQAFSHKITVLSWCLSIAIVCVHLNPSWDFKIISNNGGFFDVLFNFLNDLLTSLGSLAVSFFFMSSAYLLYRSYKLKQLPEKLKKRFYSLFVPLVLWNILCLVYKLRFGDGILETLKNIVLSNYDGPLWFVVQLLVLLLLSPLLLQLFKNKHIGLVLILISYFLPMMFDSFLVQHITDSAQQMSILSRSVYYLPNYFTGAYLAIHFDESIQLERYRKGWFVLISGLVLALTFVPSSQPFMQFLTLSQALAFWVILPNKRFKKPLNWKYQISFFIYASHIVVIGVVMRLLHRFVLDETLPVSIGTAFFGRLLFLALSVSCIYLAAWILIRWFPKVYRLLAGGRVPHMHSMF